MNELCDLIETQTSITSSDHLITPQSNWLKVADVMSTDVATLSLDETVVAAAKIMSEKKISCLMIMDNGNLAGILTETDLLKQIDGKGTDLYEFKLEQIMSYPVESVPPDLSVLQASQIMSAKRIKRLPILKEQKLVGIVTQTDLVRALTSYGMWTDISEIMSRDVADIQKNASVAEAAKIMTSRKISCIVVMNGDEVAGILTEKDLLGRVIAPERDPSCVKMEDVMSSPVTSIPPSFSVFSSSKIMEQMNIRRLVVIEKNRLCGVVTQTDILKAIKNKLQTEEEKTFKLLEESTNSIYTTDLDGMITYVNPAFMKLMEVSSSEELIGQPFLPERFWFNIEDRKQFFSELKEANHQNKDLTLKTSKNKKIYVTIFTKFIKDIHGKITGSQGIVYDVTAKKQLVALRETKEALQQSEERLKSILNSILTGVVIIDAESHKIVDANPLALELIGLSKEKVVGKICHEFICPAEKGKCPISDLGQTVDKSERVLLKDDGKKRPILKTVTTTTWQGHNYFVESFIDITDRRQAEEQIKAVIQCTGDAVRVVDKDFNVIRVNSEMEKIAGSLTDIRKCYEHFNNDFCNTDKCSLKRILNGEQRIQYEVYKATADGKNLPFELIATPLKIEDHVVGMIESFRDITERKQAEEELEQLNKDLESTIRELRRTNKELQEFAYIAAHDLKTPLRAIATLADWLSTDYSHKFDERGQERVKLLVGRVKRMHSMIDSILQYSRTGRTPQEKNKEDLNAILSEVISGIAPPENIEITIENKLPIIMCEKTQIIQVFQNLLSNAIKYMDKPQGQIKVGCVEENGFWKFVVTDNGPGIDKMYFEKIFRIFQALSPQNQIGSTGIGLSIFKKIVEVNGGKVWVESELGKGSSFFFTLPK